ncbi:DUF87 domain-containing protein [Nocardia yamanashiensis]|uniref:helicase HerA domain-containing protein n=1 Tax=Nocardia yamanashiensis TaxID=209247 RepID=UPI001E42ED03|nr:DUF87 domain-containing protein [Nocardia yamanashiensis]UGT42161.1 DUF87 domain-containing protein [Nocardia yamanashiensis]
MNEEQYQALAAVQFSSVLGPDQVWSPMRYHVDGLHTNAVRVVTHAVQGAKNRPGNTPTGVVLSGDAGVGKTHMLGWLRHYVQGEGGFFFMPKLLDSQSFWTGAVHGIVSRLLDSEGGQLGRMLDVLIERAGCGPELRMRLRGNIPLRRPDLDEFLERVMTVDEHTVFECQDALRALILFQANSRDQREIGHSFLTFEDGIEPGDRAEWGFRVRHRNPQLIFNDLSRLFALAGPIVLAVDQIDSVIARSGLRDEGDLANRLADGLMRMREETVRTLIVAACIPKSWDLIATRAVNSAVDRFTRLELSTALPSANVAIAIVERHLGSLYGEAGFEPPYPTWPVRTTAFDDPDVGHFTPRRLLQLVEGHIRDCLARNTATELEHFEHRLRDRSPATATVSAAELAAWDAEFERLRADADVVGPLDAGQEDERMPVLLGAALQCFALEQSGSGPVLTVDQPSKLPTALHGRLRRTLDEDTEDEEHWSFRAINHSNARAVLTRIRSAWLEAEIEPGSTKRRLVILRNVAFSNGPVTKTTLAELEAAQGIAIPLSANDLRTFTALAAMLSDAHTAPKFGNWLEVRRPAGRSELLGKLIGATPENSAKPSDYDAEFGSRSDGSGPDSSAQIDSMVSDPPAEDSEQSISLGSGVSGGSPFRISLAQLRKHTALYASSGSGKTVFLKRLIETVALQGVSSIVVDTNNDLAQLGDRWQSPPPGWNSADDTRSERFFADTEVVIWTPRRETGRPLALNPLPDFSGVLDDPDEFRIAIDASVASLFPRSGLTGRKVSTGTAVLTEALTDFVRGGGNDLAEFVTMLENLPEGISIVRSAAKLAAEMADQLRAAMITDPVFGGAGARLDPGALLTPSSGKRARVSVISCIGLATEPQRQTFVSQLELALFAWVKRNPAGDRPLGGLLVLDEAQTFAPSRGVTPSTASTLTLATQARKYGLGLVFATQAPKALHPMVTGNAATQFIGRLNAPAHMHAAQEVARAKGSQLDDISRMPAGQFYAATDGVGFSRIATPLCLSRHADALTEEEVLARARRTQSPRTAG